MAGSRLKRFLPAGGCKGTTKLGKPCQAKDVFENGFCKHHGGEGQSLTQRRLPLIIERRRKSAERILKKIAKLTRHSPELRRMIEIAKAAKAAKR